MKNNLIKYGAVSILVLSSSAVLFSCNKNNKTRTPHLTKFSCENLDIIEPEKFEFGKDAEITIKPKKFVKLRDENGPLIKPFVGLGNSIYITKAPLIEGVGFTYTPISDEQTSPDYQNFKLKIFGQFFTNSLVLSYSAEHTPNGEDISNCYEKTGFDYDHENSISVAEISEDKFNEKLFSVYDESAAIVNKYSTYNIKYKIPVENCFDRIEVYGHKNDSNDDVMIEGTEFTTNYNEAHVKVPNDEVYDKNTSTKKYDSLVFQVTFDTNITARNSLNSNGLKGSASENYTLSNYSFIKYETNPFLVKEDKCDFNAMNELEDLIDDKVAFYHSIDLNDEATPASTIAVSATYNNSALTANENESEKIDSTNLKNYYQYITHLEFIKDNIQLNGYLLQKEDANGQVSTEKNLIVYGVKNIDPLDIDINNFKVTYTLNSEA